MLRLILLYFVVHYINLLCQISTSITIFDDFSEKLVRIGSNREEVEHVIWVGSLIISVDENIWQKSLYMLTKK